MIVAGSSWPVRLLLEDAAAQRKFELRVKVFHARESFVCRLLVWQTSLCIRQIRYSIAKFGDLEENQSATLASASEVEVTTTPT